MINLINLTPHPILMREDDGAEFSPIPPTAPAARMTELTGRRYYVDGIPVQDWCPDWEIAGLPEPKDGTGYIVSMVAALAFVGAARAGSAEHEKREDLYIPGPEIRDGSGRIVACTGLRRVAAWPHQIRHRV